MSYYTPEQVRRHALDAHEQGLCVVPVKEDGSKRPDLQRWADYTHERPVDSVLKDWFKLANGRTGVGIVCGRVSGNLEMLETEDWDTFVKLGELIKERDPDLSETFKRIVMGYSEKAPRGGVHLYYRLPDPPPGNTKLAMNAMKQVIIETRGEGGFVVCSPSYGSVHDSGEPYKPYMGGPRTMVAITTEQHEDLMAACRALDESPPAPVMPARPEVKGEYKPGDEPPGEVYNRTTQWSEVLEGAKPAGQRGEEQFWTRPGKQHGISASTNYKGADTLKVWTSNWPPFEPDATYTKFGAYALLHHNGDFTAAAKAIAERERLNIQPGPLGQKPSSPLVEFATGLVEQRVAPEVIEKLVEEPETETWPGFVHTFIPGEHFIGDYVAWASSLTDAPHEYHEAMAFMLLAMATPGVRVKLSPYGKAGLATNLYVMLCGQSTRYRKTTTMRLMRDVYDEALGPNVMSGFIPDQFSNEALLEQLAMRARVGALWAPQELGKIMEELPKKPLLQNALLVLYDAPPAYDYSRHSKRLKGGGTEEDHDRVIDSHFNVVGATTEDIFDILSSRSVQGGLLPRFAFLWPAKLPPRMGMVEPSEAQHHQRFQLADYVRRLSEWSTRFWGDVQVELAPGVLEALNSYQQEIEDKHEHDTIVQRLPVMAMKMAVLSAVGEHVPVVPKLTVETRDMERALQVLQRWKAYALKFNASIGGMDVRERKQEQRTAAVLAFMEENGGTVIRSSVLRKFRGLSSHDIEIVEQTLEESGLIVITEEKTGGRPARTWTLT